MRQTVKLKICGMRDAENMRQIESLKPDFFGLIFYARSPRFVPIEAAKALPAFDSIKRIGVFVDEESENVLSTAAATNLSFVQLHGTESPEFCRKIKQANENLKVIKAFAVDDTFENSNLKDYEDVADYFLFDTKTKNHGGSGKSFDWQILQKLGITKPFFLSGGIGLENVAEAVQACESLPLFALDINSCAETAPGVKSAEIVRGIRELI